MRLYPAIDIMDGRVVRLKQGRAAESTEYGDDPLAQAHAFAEQGATHVHVVDLDAAFGRGANGRLIEELARDEQIAVQVGGGLRSFEDVERVLDAGAWRVVIGSAAIESPELIERATVRYGDRICVGLDAENGRLKIRGWTESTRETPASVGQFMRDLGVQTLVYTDISRDGMLGEPDVEGAVTLARDTGCRVVVSGGVSELRQVTTIAAHPERALLDGLIVGRALYEERFTVRQALDAIQREAGPC